MHRYWRVQRVRKATSGVRLELEKPLETVRELEGQGLQEQTV